MTKTGKGLVLWDIANGAKKIKNFGTDATEINLLTDDMIAGIERKMSGSLGLMPFYDISEIPQDAQWSRITDDGLGVAADGFEVYDLTWAEEKYGGSDTFKKWRVFVNPETNLPQRTEFYRKLADDEYTLRLVKVVEYLTDNEMAATVKEVGF